MREVNAVLAIATRDVIKLLRDRGRLVGSLVFPLIFIGVLGGSLQANLGKVIGYDFLTYTFTGVLAMTLFQSSAAGVISLIQDRENDFSQEMFVAPISRHTILVGKILGESMVSMLQGAAIILFGLLLQVHFTPLALLLTLPVMLASCLVGGAFGVAVLSGLNNQRSAQQVFPLLFFPQFFLAGIFNPIQVLPLPLDILSHLAPMRYCVDALRGAFYVTSRDYPRVVLLPLAVNLTVMAGIFVVLLLVGTLVFTRRERNR